MPVEVRGARKLARALRRAGVEIQDLKAANATVGQVVVRESNPLTPRSTGALAASLRPAQRQSGVVVRAGGGRVRYAKFVEFGTRKMRARSYLIRGANESEPRWMDVYWAEVQKLMDHVAAQADGTGD
jgi:HK97 gp10 family phage protein